MSADYGVVAYETTGSTPRDDPAHFDGWYAELADAEAVFQQFVEEYPTALVHIVVRGKSEWRREV
jgi:hypothetical protein